MVKTWQLKKGLILVTEDAETASLVVVARKLKNREEKIKTLEAVIKKLREETDLTGKGSNLLI